MNIYYETFKILKIKIIDINILFEKLEVFKNKIIETEISIKNLQDQKLILERLPFINDKETKIIESNHKEIISKIEFLTREIYYYSNDMKKLVTDI